MPNISDYAALTKVILIETGKYFALLLFSVLAIRLWRRWVTVSAAHNDERRPNVSKVSFCLLWRHRPFFRQPD